MYVCMYVWCEGEYVYDGLSVSQSDVCMYECMYVWCEGEYVYDGLSVSQSDVCVYVCMVRGRVCV
jgi:hypothetical protein